jgi:hypothetical protein
MAANVTGATAIDILRSLQDTRALVARLFMSGQIDNAAFQELYRSLTSDILLYINRDRS